MSGPEDADDEIEIVDLLGDLGERRRLSWQERLAGADRYGALLILIAVTIIATVVLDAHQWERLISVALIGVMLAFAMRTSQAPKSWQRVALAVVPAIVLATAFSAARGSEGSTIRAAVAAFVTLMLLAVQVAIVRRLSTHLTISWNTIMGALCVYLLFGMIFSGIYAVAGHLEDGLLFVQHDSFTSTDTLYFSLITLTTVGYGDLTMRADPMRIAAAMEALVGQIYLITAVALLVGNLGRRRRNAPKDSES